MLGYVAGVDGGGSQTSVVVVDEAGTIRGHGKAGSANHQLVGMDRAIASINEAIEAALAAAGVGASDLAFIQYGLAGADRPPDFVSLHPALQALPYGPYALLSDAWEGLRAGTEDNVGVTLVCGSGTNAIGRNAQGESVQVGGFGYLFGDAAGGSYLAQETFRTAVRAFERRTAPTVLTQMVPKALGYASMQAMYDHMLDTEAEAPLELSLVVHAAAAAGDSAARAILATMGRELGLAALAVLAQLGGKDANPYLPIVLVGSVVQKGQSQDMLAAVQRTIDGHWPEGVIKVLDVAPVYGAVRLAMDRMGWGGAATMRAQFIIERMDNRDE